MKKIINQSWSMDAEEKRMFFVEFNDGTARCYLMGSIHTIPVAPLIRSYDYDKDDVEYETVVKAARMSNSFTNQVYR